MNRWTNYGKWRHAEQFRKIKMENNIELQYLNLLEDILDNGIEKKDRTGTGTLSVFGRQIRHKMSEGFPLLTTKKMAWKTMVTELLWFLRGDTNIKYLVDNNCHIWDGDAYKNFKSRFSQMPGIQSSLPTKEEFIDKIKNQEGYAELWGGLGPIYGEQWRSWNKYDDYVDQITNLIRDLKTNPDSRRLMVSAWNVGELDQMVLPPCHYGFQVYTRELSSTERYNLLTETEKKSFIIALRPMMSPDDKYDEVHYTIDNYYKHIPTRAISLMWNQRSVDTFLGLPFNIASYGLLLEIIAKAVNMVPDELIGNLGDVHLYTNHIEQAREQLLRDPYKLPTVKHSKTDDFYKSLGDDLSLITHLDNTDFTVENYQSHPTIKAPLSN